VALGVLVAVAWARLPAAAQEASGKSLYLRLGGYDAIAAVVDDLLGRVPGDATLAPFFRGKSSDSLTKDRQMIVELLCQATGGPCCIGADDEGGACGAGYQ
jgi:hemoglobin